MLRIGGKFAVVHREVLYVWIKIGWNVHPGRFAYHVLDDDAFFDTECLSDQRDTSSAWRRHAVHPLRHRRADYPHSVGKLRVRPTILRQSRPQELLKRARFDHRGRTTRSRIQSSSTSHLKRRRSGQMIPIGIGVTRCVRTIVASATLGTRLYNNGDRVPPSAF